MSKLTRPRLVTCRNVTHERECEQRPLGRSVCALLTFLSLRSSSWGTAGNWKVDFAGACAAAAGAGARPPWLYSRTSGWFTGYTLSAVGLG